MEITSISSISFIKETAVSSAFKEVPLPTRYKWVGLTSLYSFTKFSVSGRLFFKHASRTSGCVFQYSTICALLSIMGFSFIK